MNALSSQNVQHLLKSESSFILLRSRSAHVVISFLYSQFREKNYSVISSDELEINFASFLKNHQDYETVLEQDVGESDASLFKLQETVDLQIRARKYIQSWCSDEKGYIRRYFNKDSVLVVELSPSIERLFTFLDESKPKSFVGTESRFRTILHQLRELNQNINEDVEFRLSVLRKRRAELDEEINQIEATGEVKTYTSVQIQERFEEIIRNSRSLLGEFRQVEENFREILQGIYKRQSELETTKGTILGYTLDTDAKMRESSQGQSFSSFWNFIAQDTENEIANLAHDIVQAIEERENDVYILDKGNIDFLLQLKRNLYNAGHKIVEQNHTLAEKINRVLKQQSANERQQIKELTTEIKQLIHIYTDKYGDAKTGISEDCMTVPPARPTEMNFPQARKLVIPEKNSDFDAIQTYKQEDVGFLDVSELFTQFYIDEKELLNQIAEYKKQNPNKQFTLQELIESYPIQKGLSELIAWYGIANKDDMITIDFTKHDIISYKKNDELLKVKVPRMIFI